MSQYHIGGGFLQKRCFHNLLVIVEPGIWRWIFHLFFHINLGRLKLLQDGLSTGRLAGITIVLLQDDLSTGQPEKHRLDGWSWSSAGAEIGRSAFMTEMAKYCMFSYIGFSYYTCNSPHI